VIGGRKPKVSVIVPIWNSERYLAATLQSVLAQQIRPDELIVVDDGSESDATAFVGALAPEARCCRQAHGGISAALNHGLAEAQGDYLAFVDADDLWPPASLSLRLAAFAADPDLDMVAGHVQQFISPELDASFARTVRYNPEPTPGYVMGALLVKKNVFARIGGFNEVIDAAQGVDWFVRAMDAELRIQLLPEVVMCRRLHLSNHSHLKIQHRWYPRILKASIDRRRALHDGRITPVTVPK